MAVVERRKAQDCVAVYACDTWTQITVREYFWFPVRLISLISSLSTVNRWRRCG